MLLGLLGAEGAAAQDPCPSASAEDAEAGWTAYQAGDMGAARSRFERALARCDDDQYARTGLAYVELRDGNTARAATLLQTVVRFEPNNVDALVGLGLVSWRGGDLEAVEAYFDQVVGLAPDHPTALEYLERVAGARAGSAPSTDPGDLAWRAGDTEAARRIYEERLRADPEDGVALLRTGLMLAWEERYADAIERLERLLSQQPQNMDARLARARVLAWSGDISRAQREVRGILAVAPDNVDALAALALFQSWSGDLDEALARYDEILAIAPEHAEGRRQRAQALSWSAEYEQSLDAYRSLVERSPEDVEARLGYATALGYAGEREAALAQYDEVLGRAPGEMRALTGRARILGWSGRLIEAEEAARSAVGRDSTQAQAWLVLGQVMLWQARDADAKAALERASTLAPSSPEIRDQLRSVNLALAPVARPTVTVERDSDGNRMWTTSVGGGWHPLDRLNVRATAYQRRLEQPVGLAVLERTALGVSVTGVYQLRPGWRLTAGLGGSRTDGRDDPSFASAEVGVRSPERAPVVLSLNASTGGLDETAALAERGVRADQLTLAARWMPGTLWRFDGTLGVGRYEGTESNGRRSASLVASRRTGRYFTVGTSLRGFSFEKNLGDGYFDPDFYGVAELTGRWMHRPAPWTFVVEVAPGLQQIGSDGGSGASMRTNATAAYRIAAGRELSLSLSYSTAGLTSYGSAQSGYDYKAVSLGLNWAF